MILGLSCALLAYVAASLRKYLAGGCGIHPDRSVIKYWIIIRVVRRSGSVRVCGAPHLVPLPCCGRLREHGGDASAGGDQAERRLRGARRLGRK